MFIYNLNDLQKSLYSAIELAISTNNVDYNVEPYKWITIVKEKFVPILSCS